MGTGHYTWIPAVTLYSSAEDTMLGVNYESSDEEEEVTDKVRLANVPGRTSIATNIELANVSVAAPTAPEVLPQVPPPQVDQPPSALVNGPTQGPTVSQPPVDHDVASRSPYTATRAIIQNLTLPTVPNFDIPASPPGSPPQRATKKFAQFLELKKKGQHFNQRLEGSSVLRDPGHSQKLMDFAGVSEEEQYASTLPEGLAVPVAFPPWAYFEELRASQKRILKAKEQKKSGTPRDTIIFVSASKRKDLEHRSRETSASRSPKRRR